MPELIQEEKLPATIDYSLLPRVICSAYVKKYNETNQQEAEKEAKYLSKLYDIKYPEIRKYLQYYFNKYNNVQKK